MEFYMNEERELIRQTAREFVDREVRPVAAEIDREDRFPLELIQRCAELGFGLFCLSEEGGGVGVDQTTFSVIMEELGRASSTLACTFSAHCGLVVNAIDALGTPEQKAKYLPDMITAKKIGTLCKTEPTGNADNTMWTCRAVREGDEWVINGTKVLATNIGVAEVYIVQCITDGPDPVTGAVEVTYFIVEKGTPGLEIGDPEDKVGWRGSNTGTVILDNVHVPLENRLGDFGQAATYAMPTLMEMASAGAQALGGAEEAWDMAFEFSQNRKKGDGTSYYDTYESMRTRLAAMRMEIEALRSRTYDLSMQIDDGSVNMGIAVLHKPYSAAVGESVTSQALELFGGIGTIVGTGIERYWRDAKVMKIGGGEYDILLDKASIMIGKQHLTTK